MNLTGFVAASSELSLWELSRCTMYEKRILTLKLWNTTLDKRALLGCSNISCRFQQTHACHAIVAGMVLLAHETA